MAAANISQVVKSSVVMMNKFFSFSRPSDKIKLISIVPMILGSSKSSIRWLFFSNSFSYLKMKSGNEPKKIRALKKPGFFLWSV